MQINNKPTTYANQKVVKVNQDPRDIQHKFAMMNIDAMQQACILLSKSALVLWMYMNKNQNGYTFALSVVDAVKWGISKRSYYNAIKELENFGYLVPVEGNRYNFIEHPEVPSYQITALKEQ